MNWVESVAKLQGIIGVLIGFLLNYWLSKRGTIKILERSCVLFSPSDGIDLQERKSKSDYEEGSTDFYYHSTKRFTLIVQLLLINTSSVTKVLTDFDLEVKLGSRSTISYPIIYYDKFMNNPNLNEEIRYELSEDMVFDTVSLKSGETKIFNLIAFADPGDVEDNYINKCFLFFNNPLKNGKSKRIRLNGWDYGKKNKIKNYSM